MLPKPALIGKVRQRIAFPHGNLCLDPCLDCFLPIVNVEIYWCTFLLCLLEYLMITNGYFSECWEIVIWNAWRWMNLFLDLLANNGQFNLGGKCCCNFKNWSQQVVYWWSMTCLWLDVGHQLWLSRNFQFAFSSGHIISKKKNN